MKIKLFLRTKIICLTKRMKITKVEICKNQFLKIRKNNLKLDNLFYLQINLKEQIQNSLINIWKYLSK